VSHERQHTAIEHYTLGIEDKPGAAAAVLNALAAGGVNMIGFWGCGGAGRYGALIYVAEDDVKKAGKILLGK